MNSRANQPCLASCDGAVPVNEGAKPTLTTDGGGKLSRIAHFRRLEHLRRLPGNCRRCGHPSATPTCDRCREYHRRYKARVKAAGLQTADGVAPVLAQFRRELTALRKLVKSVVATYRRGYRKGYASGLAFRRARFREDVEKYTPPTVSLQEAAEFDHRFRDDE